MNHEEQCNCDQALVLGKLLADARDIIAEHCSLDAGLEWMEELHRSWAFRDPRPPGLLRDYVTARADRYFDLLVKDDGLWTPDESKQICGHDISEIMEALHMSNDKGMDHAEFVRHDLADEFVTLIQGTEDQYRVSLSKADNWTCRKDQEEIELCKGFKFRGKCKHIDEAKDLR